MTFIKISNRLNIKKEYVSGYSMEGVHHYKELSNRGQFLYGTVVCGGQKYFLKFENRKKLRQWFDTALDSIDWRPYIKEAADSLEKLQYPQSYTALSCMIDNDSLKEI